MPRHPGKRSAHRRRAPVASLRRLDYARDLAEGSSGAGRDRSCGGDVARGQRRAQEIGQAGGDVGDAAAQKKMHRLVKVAARGERVGLGEQDLRRARIRAPFLLRLGLLAGAPPWQPPGDTLRLQDKQENNDRDASDHRAPEQIDHVGADLCQGFQKRLQPFRRFRPHQRRQIKLDRIVRQQLLVHPGQPFGVARARLCDCHPRVPLATCGSAPTLAICLNNCKCTGRGPSILANLL